MSSNIVCKRWSGGLNLYAWLCKPAFLCDELVFIRLLTIIITTFENIAIKPRQAIRLMLCVCVCLYYAEDFGLCWSRGLWGEERGGGLIGGCLGHECLYTEANIETDRRTDRHSRRFQLDRSICQALLLWFHTEAGEKGSVVKHLDGESDSCRTQAWDGRKNWSVRPGVAIGLKHQADTGAEICWRQFEFQWRVFTAVTLNPKMITAIIRGPKWRNWIV